MTMKNPPHPGRIVRQECIEPLGLTVTEAAERLLHLLLIRQDYPLRSERNFRISPMHSR